MDNVREDLEERGIQLSTAYGKTKDREVWRSIIRASFSASCRKRRKKNFWVISFTKIVKKIKENGCQGNRTGFQLTSLVKTCSANRLHVLRQLHLSNRFAFFGLSLSNGLDFRRQFFILLSKCILQINSRGLSRTQAHYNHQGKSQRHSQENFQERGLDLGLCTMFG